MTRFASSAWGWALGSAIAVAGSFGIAWAQDTAPAGDAADVGLDAPRTVTLSAPEMEQKLNEYLPEMESGAAGVRRQLEQARAARDVVKTLCLNDKLNQIDVANRSASDRAQSLRLALTRKDMDRSRHEFTVVQVLRDRVRDLVTEANQCIGEEGTYFGESSVTVNVDPTIPDDPTDWVDEPPISIPPILSTPPILSSPTQ